MGAVYRAHDDQLDRDVAIKVLSASTFSDPVAWPRLLREARSVGALSHPNVCTVHEVGEADGQVYIAMEWIEGQPLDRLIPEGGFPVDHVLRYGLQIARGVARYNPKNAARAFRKAKINQRATQEGDEPAAASALAPAAVPALASLVRRGLLPDPLCNLLKGLFSPVALRAEWVLTSRSSFWAG
jgi:serine/threonine protein kinase